MVRLSNLEIIIINHDIYFLDDRLVGTKDQFLNVGMYLQSSNGCFRLIMQDDGNLVTYNLKAGAPSDSVAMWASNTVGSVRDNS